MLPKGLCAFPLTPSDADGRVDAPALRKLVGRLCAAGVDGIGVLGSTGTYAYLSRTERRFALDAALAEAGSATPVLVGIGALRTDEAIALAQDAKAAGATAGLLAAMSYTPLTDDEVFEHVTTVARAGGLPLCIYDNPATTHFRFSTALVGRLAHEPGIIGVKSPTTDPSATAAHVAELHGLVPEGFSLGYSGDWNCTEALLAGADLWHSVIAGLFPEIGVALTRAATSGDAAEARRLDARLEPLWALFRAYSSLRVIYAAAALMDICHAVPPRPILRLPEAARIEVRDVLVELGEL